MRFTKSHFFLLISTILWSGSVLFIKIGVQYGHPVHMAALRFILGALIMVPLLLASGAWPKGLTRADWLTLFRLGFFGVFIYNVLFFFSLRYTSAIEGALIMAASPVAHFIIAAITEKERLTPQRAGGIALSVGGIIVVIVGGHGVPIDQAPNRLLGDALMFGAMFFWALNTSYARRLGGRVSPAATMGLPIAMAAVLYLAITLPTGLVSTAQGLPPTAWGALTYLVIGSSILGRQFWFAGLRGVDMTQAGVFFNLMPVWSSILAAIFLDERFGLTQIAGGILVLGGVLFTNTKA